LPSALFEIHALTSLTLRKSASELKIELMIGSNRLTRLPAAIGELHNLKELNIGNNKIVRSSRAPSGRQLMSVRITLHSHSSHKARELSCPPQPMDPTTYYRTYQRATARAPRLAYRCQRHSTARSLHKQSHIASPTLESPSDDRSGVQLGDTSWESSSAS